MFSTAENQNSSVVEEQKQRSEITDMWNHFQTFDTRFQNYTIFDTVCQKMSWGTMPAPLSASSYALAWRLNRGNSLKCWVEHMFIMTVVTSNESYSSHVSVMDEKNTNCFVTRIFMKFASVIKFMPYRRQLVCWWYLMFEDVKTQSSHMSIMTL